MSRFIIISKPGCGHCTRAKAMLATRGLEYIEDLRDTEEAIEAFKDAGYRTFPQVFEDGIHIGGADDLEEYLEF